MSTTSDAVERVEFDVTSFEPRHRLDAWRSFYSEVLDVQSLEPQADAIEYSVNGRSMGDLMFGRASYNSRCALVGRADHRFVRGDMLVMCVNLKGTAQAVVGDQPVQFRPGTMHIIDRTQPLQVFSKNREALLVCVPNAADVLGYDGLRRPAHTAYGINVPVGRVLWSAIENIFNIMPTADAAEGALLADGFAAMLRRVIGTNANDESARHHFEQARLTMLKEYVDRNLHKADLCVDRICKDVGVSRATLYRVFPEDEGVSRYILRRRLEGAFLSIGRSMPSRGLVKKVAQDWGFQSQATFARQFRDQFGFSPSDAIGSLCVEQHSTGAVTGDCTAVRGMAQHHSAGFDS
ncbi:MAG: AraC family transcriptional regulator [Pseudomonadota bacterium]